ncbi:MAG: diacylglycerol kinase [Pirellulales bacterium]
MLQTWLRKFGYAFRGVAFGIRGQSSFAVHLPVAIAVIALAAFLNCAMWEWCILLLCIGLVIAAELMNSSIEELARGLCREHNEHVGRALDTAAGAVLIAAVFSAVVGCLILGARTWALFVVVG